jgi:serine/threonine protein kinase
MNDTVMERLGRYQIREIIGEGAMACVYKAFDPEINRPLAIKLLKAQLRLDGEYRNRFLREAKGAGVLSHPNIVTVFDVGEDQGHPYIAMELVEGGTLAEEIKASKPLSTQQIVEIGIQLARALDYAHKRGIVHRDVKPGNIMRLTDSNTIKVADFGICRIDGSEAGDATQADADRQRARNAALHVARAGDRRESGLALRSLLRRRRHVPAADGPPALRGRHADQRRLQDHQDGPAVPRQDQERPAAVAPARDRACAQEAARQAIPDGRGVRAGAARRAARARRKRPRRRVERAASRWPSAGH